MPRTTKVRSDDGTVSVYTARRRKYRFNCCSCGKQLPNAPTTWAFCTKKCERTKGNGGDDGTQMSPKVADEYLKLSKEREEAPEFLKGEYTARMAALHPTKEKTSPVGMDERPQKSQVEFWKGPVKREFEKLRNMMVKVVEAGKRLGLVLLDAKAHMESESDWRDLCSSVPGGVADGAMAVAYKGPKGFMNEIRRLFKK